MKTRQYRVQSGFALLIFVVVLMGIGGLALSGFAQKSLKEVEKRRFEQNKEVLLQAKQALLMYAYNYPTIAGRGPGRLPCPDTDNNGRAESPSPCQNNIEIVGRLPWDNPGFDFYDARDTSGQRLWYAVSATFDYGPIDIINSESTGSISIFDQTGSLVYSGAVDGVAAVIIAPGPAINGQDRSIGNGDDPFDAVPDTDPGITNAANYLDNFNVFDNSGFLNGGVLNGDGFILGPVYNNTDIVINDQVVVITTDEIVAMAEKATLETYRNALNQYAANTDPGNTGFDRYPWLDPYNTDNIGLGYFDAVVTPVAPSPVIGRLPSIFANYFVGPDINDSQSIKPEVRLTVTIEDEIHHMTLPAPAVARTFFRGVDGDLVSQINTGETYTRFFWDGPTPFHAQDNVWEMCPFVSGDEEDCNQDVAGNFIGGAVSDVVMRMREIVITFSGGNPIEFAFVDRTALAIEFWRNSPENPDPSNHVYIAAEYDDNKVYFSNFSYVQDDSFQNNHVETPLGNNATLVFGNGANDRIKVGLPYYPVLPVWALDNNWHDKMQMAYSSEVQPGGDGACDVGVDCLTLLNFGGITNDKLAILIQSGTDLDSDADADPLFIDGPTTIGAPLFFSDELPDLFEGENNTSPQSVVLVDKLTFDRRPNNGNDIVLIVQ